MCDGSGWNWADTKEHFNRSAIYHNIRKPYLEDLTLTGDKGGSVHVLHANLVPDLRLLCAALQEASISKGQEVSVNT